MRLDREHQHFRIWDLYKCIYIATVMKTHFKPTAFKICYTLIISITTKESLCPKSISEILMNNSEMIKIGRKCLYYRLTDRIFVSGNETFLFNWLLKKHRTFYRRERPRIRHVFGISSSGSSSTTCCPIKKFCRGYINRNCYFENLDHYFNFIRFNKKSFLWI